MIKRGHKLIINILPKISTRGFTNWIHNLLAIFWVDQSTIHTSTNLILYYITYGNKPVLFIELEIPI